MTRYCSQLESDQHLPTRRAIHTRPTLTSTPFPSGGRSPWLGEPEATSAQPPSLESGCQHCGLASGIQAATSVVAGTHSSGRWSCIGGNGFGGGGEYGGWRKDSGDESDPPALHSWKAVNPARASAAAALWANGIWVDTPGSFLEVGRRSQAQKMDSASAGTSYGNDASDRGGPVWADQGPGRQDSEASGRGEDCNDGGGDWRSWNLWREGAIVRQRLLALRSERRRFVPSLWPTVAAAQRVQPPEEQFFDFLLDCHSMGGLNERDERRYPNPRSQ
jgi:hypothetical protein